MSKLKPRLSLPALKVQQWLAEWDEISWDPKALRREPEKCFYQFSISAADLKALSGVYRRTTVRKRSSHDTGIQRRHEPERSEEIQRFVRSGYPWSDLSEAKRKSSEFDDLRKPGWLPTAIVVNILGGEDKRAGETVDKDDLIRVRSEEDGAATIVLPSGFSGSSWRSKSLPPIEVIDGQHRLWAFEDGKGLDDFQLPVVAFHGLDLSWQAYLFYTINIKPKKINASLAFDLYPLLRTEDWLERFEGHIIYRETRAQELVDILWSHAKSPWHERINMLGETGTGKKMVSQAAWIRSLLATIVKSSEGKRVSIGGLFGAPVGTNKQTLPWSRAEQAAFLIFASDALRGAVAESSHEWAESLRNADPQHEFPGLDSDDPAFYGPHTLLTHDQGIRAFLHAVNDFCFVSADSLKLGSWKPSNGREDTDAQIDEAISSLGKSPSGKFIEKLTSCLASFDWRGSDARGLSEDERLRKAALRGSGGYKELRHQLLNHVEDSGGDLARAAVKIKQSLGYR